MSKSAKHAIFAVVLVSFLSVQTTLAATSRRADESNWAREFPRSVWTWIVERSKDLIHITDVISVPGGTPTVSPSGGQ